MTERERLWLGLRPFRRHSLVLLISGTVYIIIGVTYLTADPPPTRTASLVYALRIMEYQHWGYVWIGVGVMAVISSRWPPISETWGYMALTGLSAGWAAFYWVGITFGNGPVANYSGVLSWGIIAFLWWAISGLVNPQAIVALSEQVLDLQSENIILLQELSELRTPRK